MKIYEYTPGFLHAKCYVSDDHVAVVGSINMDYRSLFLHFECGTLLYRNSQILALRDDVLNTLRKCREVCSSRTAAPTCWAPCWTVCSACSAPDVIRLDSEPSVDSWQPPGAAFPKGLRPDQGGMGKGSVTNETENTRRFGAEWWQRRCC